jgi:hypothetical protein
MKFPDRLKAAISPDPLMPPAELRFAILQSAMYDQLDGAIEFIASRLEDGTKVTVAELLRINFLSINYADVNNESWVNDPEKLREMIENCAENLESYWDVIDTESALKTLHDLRTIGHRTHHAELIALIQNSGCSDSKLHEMPWNDLVKLVGEFDLTGDRPPNDDGLDYNPDPENLGLGAYYAYQVACKRRDIQILQANLRYLGKAGTLAWDVARHSQVVRLACGAEYIDDIRAKEEIQKMNAITRENFNSWIAFGDSFLVGLEVFRGGGSPEPGIAHFREQMPTDSREHFDDLQFAIDTLNRHPQSPWLFWGW